MHPNAQLIERFYTAFAKRDADAMNACTHPDLEFTDEVFVGLKGDEARGMWTMLCERGTDLRIEFRDITADDTTGSAHWEARYTFSATEKPVLNVIDATFEFQDGLIRRHRDRFDLPRWEAQALGASGKLLGRLPFFQKALRRKARAGLTQFLASRAGRSSGR